jgi:hypothetical protein
MGKIPRLVLWLCRKFTRQDLQELVHELQEILAGRQPSAPRRLSPAASALSRFLRRSPGSLDPASDAGPCNPHLGLAAVGCPVSTRPWSATVSGSAAARCPPAAAHLPLRPLRRNPHRSSTSTMVAQPANCVVKSVVAGRSSLAASVRPRLPTGAPTATVPSTAGNSAPTPRSTSALATAAPTTSGNNKP